MAYQERIYHHIYQLRITSYNPKVLALMNQLLLNWGFAPSDIIEGQDHKGAYISICAVEALKLKKVSAILKKAGIVDVLIELNTLKPRDWLTKWQEHWKPAALTKKIDIVPLWYRQKYQRKVGRKAIYLNTLLSFGSGLHETTQIVAQMIEDHLKSQMRFLDIGTGTGILSLVAMVNQAKEVLAIDIGQLSVDAAKSNAQVNRKKMTVKLADIGKFKVSRPYDFVAANLVTHDLIKFRKAILNTVKPGGLLSVSGVSVENLQLFKEKFLGHPIVLMDLKVGKQWAGAIFKKVTS